MSYRNNYDLLKTYTSGTICNKIIILNRCMHQNSVVKVYVQAYVAGADLGGGTTNEELTMHPLATPF